MFFKSIRFKMMLWYMLLLTVTLLSFSSILYGSFSKMLYGSLDDLLSSRAEGVVNSIDAYWSAKETGIQLDEAKLAGFAKNASTWVEEKRKDLELMSIFVQIMNRKGEQLIASKNMPHLDGLAKDDLADILEGDDSFDSIKGVTTEGKKIRFRMYSRPVSERGEVEYIVQVAGPISLLSLATHNLIWVLFVLLPLTVLLAGIPGVLLVTLTLRPVDKMIDALKQTTAENLKLRIHIPDTKDEIKRLADTFNDMIERLDRSFSSQQNFIQEISLELKTPLAALVKEFASCQARTLSSQEYASIVRRGLDEMSKLGAIIEDLETLAKYDNDQIALEIRKVKLSTVLEKVLDDVRAKADEKDIILSSFLRDTIVIDGDEKRLRQLFASLLDNAIRYTNRKGKVTVSAARNKASAVITVSDTGIGIEDSELPYIFDRFYQVNKSRNASGSFGLGLSVAKSVADVHKGAVKVESKLGAGSTFTVILPLTYPG